MLNMFFCVSLLTVLHANMMGCYRGSKDGSLIEILRTHKWNKHSPPVFKRLQRDCSHVHNSNSPESSRLHGSHPSMLPHPSVCVQTWCDRLRIILLIFSLKHGLACGPEPQLQFKSAVPKLLLQRHIFGYKVIFSSPAVIQGTQINTLTCMCITGHPERLWNRHRDWRGRQALSRF